MTRFNIFRLKCVGATSVEKNAFLSDRCLICSFIHSSFLAPAKLFRKDSVVYGATARIYTMYCCKHYSKTSRLKTVQHITVTEMHTLLSLLYKKGMFFKYIERQSWPCTMFLLRNNLLLTTVTDAELCENQENGNNVIPSVLNNINKNIFTYTLVVWDKWDLEWEKGNKV